MQFLAIPVRREFQTRCCRRVWYSSQVDEFADQFKVAVPYKL